MEDWRRAGRHGRPRLLTLDVHKAQKTERVKKGFRQTNTITSYIPSGCTSVVQVLDVSLNRILKDEIGRLERLYLEKHPEVWEGKVSLSERRIEITQWVGRTWKWLHEEKLPIITKGFRVVGLTLAVDGSEDKDLAIKDMPDLKVGDWRLPETPAIEEVEFCVAGDGKEKGAVTDNEVGEAGETQEVEVDMNGNDILPPTWDDKDCYQLTEDDRKYITELEKGLADPSSDLGSEEEEEEEDLSWYENAFGLDDEEANAVWHTAPLKRKRKDGENEIKAKKAKGARTAKMTAPEAEGAAPAGKSLQFFDVLTPSTFQRSC